MLRGIYSDDDFKPVTKYGMKVYVSNAPELTAYIDKIISQLKSKIFQEPFFLYKTNV